MKPFTLLAQATYSCDNATDGSYGAGNFGTCDTSATSEETTQTVGAPDTGTFLDVLTGGSFSVILPLVIATVVIVAATIIIIRKKRPAHRS